MRILDVHRRELPAPPELVEALLGSLASSDDRLWPSWRWPAMRFRGGARPGATGGHGPIRYRVVEWTSRRAVFAFEPRGPMRGLHGTHRFEVEPSGEGTRLSHVIDARCGPATGLLWRSVIHPLHDALIEDALDRAEAASRGETRPTPRPLGPWVRALRRLLRRLG